MGGFEMLHPKSRPLSSQPLGIDSKELMGDKDD
jgi:hypothetical protein